MVSKLFLSVLSIASVAAQSQQPQILSDPGTYGPKPEIVHLYYDQFPTGIAVSRSGRMFSNYPPALDPNNQAYTVAEIFVNNTERAYPNTEINTPPGGRINNTVYPPVGASSATHFTGVQSVVIDPADRLWVLDTGRVATQNGTMVPAAYGGPKLVGIDLTTNQIFQTIVFTPMAAPADSVCGLVCTLGLDTDSCDSTSMTSVSISLQTLPRLVKVWPISQTVRVKDVMQSSWSTSVQVKHGDI